MREPAAAQERGKPPTVAGLLKLAGDAQSWWGAITAFLVDSYRTQPTVRWEPLAEAWGQTYRKGSRSLAHIVPQDGCLLVFIPFGAAAVSRGTANPALLDPAARTALDNYVAGESPMPAVCVRSDIDVDAVIRLVALAHPRKGHPCGSL
ncbi:MAG: DUF3788 family protein [Candidatus Cryosericum sp.]